VSDSFSIIVSSDPQYPWYDFVLPAGLEGNYDDELGTVRSNSERQIREQYQSMNRLVEDLASTYPVKGVLINGDVTAYGHDWQHAKMMELLKIPKVQIYPILGNHDYGNNVWLSKDGQIVKDIFGNPVRGSADHHAPSRMVDWMSSWIRDAASHRRFDGGRLIVEAYDLTDSLSDFSGSLAYSFIIGNVRFIQLQNYPSYTAQWTRLFPYHSYKITSSLGWFEAELQKAKKAGNMIIVSLHDYDEAFAWSGRNGTIADDVKKFARLVGAYGVSAVFAGHIHQYFGYKGLVSFGTIPHFRSGAASFQDYLVVQIDPPANLTVWPMASLIGGRYAPNGYYWKCTPTATTLYPAKEPFVEFFGPKAQAIYLPDPAGALPPPNPASPLAGGFSWSGISAEGTNFLTYLYYVDSKLHIHEIERQDQAGKFAHRDLTTVANANAKPAFGSPLVCLVEENGTLPARTLFYLELGQYHVHRIHWDGSTWSHDDLTAVLNPPGLPSGVLPAGKGSGLTCCGSESNAHVFYIGPDQHVHRIHWDGKKWEHEDLTTLAEAANIPVPVPPAVMGSAVTCFGSGNNTRVFYFSPASPGDTDLHVHQIFWDGQKWGHDNLSILAGAENAPAVIGSGLTSFGPGSDAHVFYVGANRHVHCLYWTGDQWVHVDLTNPADASDEPPVIGTGLACFGPGTNAHVFYVALNKVPNGKGGYYKGYTNLVHVYRFDSGWHHAQLRWEPPAAAQPPVGPGSPLICFSPGGRTRIYHIGDADHLQVQELWWRSGDGSRWRANSLPGAPPGWNPDPIR